jgi:hypothetical protein
MATFQSMGEKGWLEATCIGLGIFYLQAMSSLKPQVFL